MIFDLVLIINVYFCLLPFLFNDGFLVSFTFTLIFPSFKSTNKSYAHDCLKNGLVVPAINPCLKLFWLIFVQLINWEVNYFILVLKI